jgi:hypothetical protein
MRIGALAALLVLILAGPTFAAAPGEMRAWVQYGAAGLQIRAVSDAAACPTAIVDGRPAPLALRAAPSPGFPDRLCQLVLPKGARQASLNGQALPIPAGPPRRILIFGDTGCRVKHGLVQDCNNDHGWPFGLVSRLAAAHHPDLVIHVGDYLYRETPCPPGLKACAGSPWGDNWPTWRADFFDPAQPLLAAAPFVFVRGNHETCLRSGAGWFRLLDGASTPTQCPAASPAYAVDLGDLALYVLDSSSAKDPRAPRREVAQITRQLDILEPRLAQKPGWLLTHRPVWGLTPFLRIGPFGPLEAPLNRTEQIAVSSRDLSAVTMVVSGHIHHFDSLSFGPERPAQLIVGTGGDAGEWSDVHAVRQASARIDGLTARRLSFAQFGYFLFERQGPDWVGTFRNLDDKPVAVCRAHGRDLTCRPA